MRRLLIAVVIAVSADAQSVVSLSSDDGVPVRFIVPLGIEAPPDAAAAFRIVARVPAGLNGELAKSGREFRMSVDSELVPEVMAPETPPRYPKSRLSVPMQALYPQSMHEQLKFQRGANKLQSPVIIAIADPRASIDYTWAPGADKLAAGCYNCERPKHLKGKTQADGVYELFTNGRYVSVKPLPGVFVGTVYAFYGELGRLELRVPTVMADTIRPPAVLVAAIAPPIAGGLLQETTYLHSGELETGSVDLDAGGRAGWNVVLDRTYRSSTIGLSPLGAGWDASMFRRLRPLPKGNVEYRDGAGEIWTFAKKGDLYEPPQGLFLRLSKTGTGWMLTDQKTRFTSFDELGRLVRESDEFFDPNKPDSGNTIHYFYGSDGRLATIIDPVTRVTHVKFDRTTGLLKDITDWRSRRIEYTYDAYRLSEVKLPEVANSSGQRPLMKYGYESVGATLKDQLELAPNLTTIRDPKEAITNGAARVTFRYSSDRVREQEWATGEKATFTYALPAQATVKDVLGQERRYTLTANSTSDPLADRAHATEVREVAVPVWGGAAFGQLAGILAPGAPVITAQDRVQTFSYESGVTKTARLDGVRETRIGYEAAKGAPGLVVQSTLSTPISGTAPSFMPTVAPIQRTFTYQSGSLLDSVIGSSGKVEVKEPSRSNPPPTATNDAIAAKTTFDDHGQLKASESSGGKDPASAGAKAGIEYYGTTDRDFMRGRPWKVREGEGEDLVTVITYPSATQTKSTDPRYVTTTTDVDAWDRPIKVQVEKPGDLVLLQTFEYDATGRLEKTTQKQGAEEVLTTLGYDAMGRRTSATTNNIATVGSIGTTTTYELVSRKITTARTGSATTVTHLDSLGRAIRSVTDTGSGLTPIDDRFAYDLAGNRVFASDMYTVATSAFDAHGRTAASRAANGTVATTEYDEWSRPKEVKSLDKETTATVAKSTFKFTPSGRLEEIKAALDAGKARETTLAWDGGGRTTRTATNGRASETAYDSGGRMLSHARGEGDLAALKIITRSQVKHHDGDLPKTVESTEKSGATYTSTTERNTTGDVTSEKVGPLEWKTDYDELGNVTEASAPRRPPTKWDVDARGAVEKETLPDGAENKHEYDSSGAEKEYEDPTAEQTITDRDLIGRPIKRTYQDLTTEIIEWEGRRVKSVTDRQKRKQTYVYNSGGEVKEIRDGANAITDLLDYDKAGRLISWKTADAELTWGEFDLDGNPKRTSQKRFRNSSGLSVNAAVPLDEVVQQHRWNEHGERKQFSMPVAGGIVLGAAWTKWLQQDYDALGNVTGVARIDDDLSLSASAPLPVMSASYRAAGRPDQRTLVTAGGPIVRTYDYHPQSSLLNRMEVKAKGVVIAGSAVQHDGLQTSEARMLGIASGERVSRFAYDDRSRLTASVFGTKSPGDPTVAIPGRAREELDPADFRQSQERTPVLNAIAAVDTSKFDPPTATFAEKPGGGHKIDSVTRGPTVRPFGYDGAERIDDGRFVYTFDARGRLIRATEKSTLAPIRRMLYAYTGTGRLIGRRAEYASIATPSESDWKLEDRAQILTSDALPAETTFAWDPITDRLLAVFPAGNTNTPLKQILHGESAYDDPLETTTLDRATGNVIRVYPIYDEAATGGLQTVLNAKAEVIARNLSNDPYGAHDLAMTGPAIDGAAIAARKNAAGAIDRVTVSLHATEQLSPASLATGVRLAALDASGAVVRVSSLSPTLTPDPYTVQWSLSATEWTALTASPATTISIAATSTLRASTWGEDVPIMPAPEWTTASQPVFTSPDLPVEVRESLSSLASYLAGIPSNEERTTAIYTIETLALLGTATRGTALASVLSAGFQALPFAEATTGLIYARARWFDPSTGSFLSPDPMGYRDSSNLYAFGGGDPINGRDPTGELTEAQLQRFIKLLNKTTRAGKGTYGERVLERMLRKSGRVILSGPITTGHAWNQGGADIIAYNPSSKKIEFWDNKFFMFKKNVSAADTLTNPIKLQRNIDGAMRLLRVSNIPDRARLMFNLARGHGYLRYIGGGGIGNNVKGITMALKSLNVRFGSASFIKRSGLGLKALKGAALVGTLIAISGYAEELQAATAEDRVFAAALDELGPGCVGCDQVSAALRNASLLTSLVGMGGEEILGNLGSAAGAALAGFLGLSTGPGAILTAAAGSLAGGMIGDAAGRGLGTSLVDFVMAEDDTDTP